jgi:hypothetical protein
MWITDKIHPTTPPLIFRDESNEPNYVMIRQQCATVSISNFAISGSFV